MNIQKSDIRKLVSATIYSRGRDYFERGKVRLVDAESHSFRAIVSGSSEYMVEVFLTKNGWFYGECTCPYWDNCKHIVAAMLTAKEFYQQSVAAANKSGSNWKNYLSQIQHLIPQPSAQPKKWQLMFTLEIQLTSWSLTPCKSRVRKDGSLGEARRLSNGDFFETSVNRNRNDDLALGYLEKWQNRRPYYSYDYRPSALTRFQFGEAMGSVFDLLRESHLYFSETNGTRSPVQFAKKTAEIEFRIDRQNDRCEFRPVCILNGDEMPLDESFDILTSNPVWILWRRCLVEVSNLNDAASLIPFTMQPLKVTIPDAEISDFLKTLLPQNELFENLKFPNQTKTQVQTTITEKRLVLSEFEHGVSIQLMFSYADVEVDYNNDRETFWGYAQKSDSFIKVVRDKQSEDMAFEELRATNVKHGNFGKFITKKNKTLEWLIDEVPNLTARGFTIYGEEKLRTYKINRSSPQVRVSVSSNIDWFDLNVEIDVGGVLLSVKELRKALKRRSQFVKLADGGSARLSDEWLGRFRHLLNFSDSNGERLKFSNFHVTLIDELFSEASQRDFDAGFQERLQKLQNFQGIEEHPVPAALQGDLRPYQKEGFHWLLFLQKFQFGGCLADDMGLGKTIQSLALLLLTQGEKLPSLIVTPTSVVFNWLEEIQRFAPTLRVHNQTGTERDRTSKHYRRYDIVLTSYGTLRQDIIFLKDVEFNYVILDESQFIKNPLSQTAKATRLLRAKNRLALTGTPIENNTTELWSLFAFLNPGLLGNLHYFKTAFAKPIEREKDEGRVELLRKMVFPFILRRTKAAVATELPPKVENIIYCEMSQPQQKLYNQWRDYFRAGLLKQISDHGLNKSRMNVLEGLVKLRQIACHPVLVDESYDQHVGKFDLLTEYLAEMLSEGHKVLVFSQFVKMLRVIRAHLDSADICYEYLDGRTRDRQGCVTRFQNQDKYKIFLISLKAGGTGLNLTAADYVIHYDPWWNPAVETQATDRSHRIGQSKHVFVYKMITKGTVEEKILDLQERKKALVSSIISTERGFFKHLTVDDIKVLFE